MAHGYVLGPREHLQHHNIIDIIFSYEILWTPPLSVRTCWGLVDAFSFPEFFLSARISTALMSSTEVSNVAMAFEITARLSPAPLRFPTQGASLAAFTSPTLKLGLLRWSGAFPGLGGLVGIQQMTGRSSKEWLSKKHFQFFNCSQDHLEPFLLHPMWLCQGYMPRPKFGWAALAQEDPGKNLIGRLSQRLWVHFVQLIENFCMSGTVQRVPGFRKDKFTVHIVERKWNLRRFKWKTFYEW